MINKTALLKSLEEKIDKHLEEAIHVFRNLNDDKLLQPATDGGWSIAQCLEHLNGYGRYYLPLIQKELKKNGGKSKDHFKSSWLGKYSIRMMESEKNKLKAFKGHIPPKELNSKEVVAEFIRQQEGLKKILHSCRKSDLTGIRIPISISRFISLKLGDLLQFIIAHNERHLKQAKRLLKSDVNKN